jgi:hypothetical protein
VVSGEYFFEDGLKWEAQQWRYLSKQKGERRYYTEQLSAIPPAGLSKRHDREPPPNVPIGKYDTGNAPPPPLPPPWLTPATASVNTRALQAMAFLTPRATACACRPQLAYPQLSWRWNHACRGRRVTRGRYSYEGMLLRPATQAEAQWIVDNCRATRRLADPVIPA